MSRPNTHKAPIVSRDTSLGDEPEPLTRSQLREIDRRIRDLDNRTRYLLVSVFTSRSALYYNVSEDTFGMNTPASGTLFKRRTAAASILELLGSNVRIVACRVNRRGRLVRSSVPRLRPTWQRKVRHSEKSGKSRA